MSEKFTESEEMYLVNVASLQEGGGEGAVPLSSLAAALNVQPVSANQKVHELVGAGLLAYTPYRGVVLTDSGRAAAMSILRRRRLWEVFLVERLNFSVAEAGILACRLEHTLPPEAAERLAEYLGNPGISPAGRPIPEPTGAAAQPPARPASGLAPGEPGLVVDIRLDPAGRAYLESQGIKVGSSIRVLAAGETGDLLVGAENGVRIALAGELAAAIWVAVHQE